MYGRMRGAFAAAKRFAQFRDWIRPFSRSFHLRFAALFRRLCEQRLRFGQTELQIGYFNVRKHNRLGFLFNLQLDIECFEPVGRTVVAFQNTLPYGLG